MEPYRQEPLIAESTDNYRDDYRYLGDAITADNAHDKYKRWAPAARANLRDKILQSAAAQEQLFVVVDQLEIEPGWECSRCHQYGKHARQCEPPRGLVRSTCI